MPFVGVRRLLPWLSYAADFIDVGELQRALRGMGILYTVPDTKLLINSLGGAIYDEEAPKASQVPGILPLVDL